MIKNASPDSADGELESDEVFELAAEVFRVMSAPMRLKIISALCNGEKNVGQLLEEISTTQPNMSQHLNTLYKSGVLGRRRDGVQIYYRIINERVVTLCRAVCTQIAIESAGDWAVEKVKVGRPICRAGMSYQARVRWPRRPARLQSGPAAALG